MRQSILNSIIIFLFCSINSGFSKTFTNPLGPQSPICRTISELAAAENYAKAWQIADSIDFIQPEDPLGPFLRVTILSFQSIDFEDDFYNEAILKSADEVERRIRNCIQNGESTAELYFYLGSIEFYRTIVSERNGSFLKSVKQVIKSGGYFRKAVKLDSSCWDAYHGLGLFKYYKSQKAGFLRTIGIVSDERSKGLEHIELSSQKGCITALSAKSSLIWIAIEMNEFKRADSLLTIMLKRYPTTRAFLWAKGRIEFHRENWDEVIVTYGKILKSVRTESRNNHYNEIGCLHSIGKAYYNLENWESVIKIADTAKSIDISPDISKRKKADLKRLSKMKQKAVEHLKIQNGK